MFIPANLFITYALARLLKQNHFAGLHAEQAADFNMSFTAYVLGGLFTYALLMLGANDMVQALSLGLSTTEVDALSKRLAQGTIYVVTIVYLILVGVASIRALLGREHRYPFSLGWHQRIEKALGGAHSDHS